MSFYPDWVMSPGERLSVYIEDSKLSDKDVAQCLGLSNSELNLLLRGKLLVDERLAEALEAVTGLTNWMKLEKDYRKKLDQGQPRPRKLHLYEYYTISEF